MPVRAFERSGDGARLVLPVPANPGGWDAAVGDSVSVSGACLSVARRTPREGAAEELGFDLSGETLARTWFSELAEGRLVNLERALRLGERLDGHLVSGHVDGGARLVGVRDEPGGGRRLEVEVDAGLERYLVPKGSITLDGVSLTVVDPSGPRFSVAAIPLTLELTSLGEARPGQRLNVEADMIGKWIERLLAERS